MPVAKQATLNQGIEAYSQGRMQEARSIFQQVLEQQSANFDANHLLGATHLALGEAELAIERFRQAIAILPSFAPVYANLGYAWLSLGKLQDARQSFERAVQVQPDYVVGWLSLANLLRSTACHAEAITAYDRLLQIQPDNAAAHCDRGLSFHELGMDEQAVVSYDRALQVDSASVMALSHRGVSLQKLGRWEDAMRSFDMAISIDPDNFEAWLNRGTLLRDMGNYDQALADLDQAIQLNAGSALAWNNRGLVLKDLLHHADALENFERALHIAPDFVDALWNQSLCRLSMGDFSQGLPQYEVRHRVAAFARYARHFPKPQWLGESVAAGSVLLLHAEQGLGDAIQFVRYVPLLAKKGLRIVLESPPSLFPLFSEVAGVWQCVKGGEPLPHFDVHCPLPSLPLVMGTLVETIPAAIPYLQASPEKIRTWQDWMGARQRIEVGLVCSGNPEHGNDRNRSVPLRLFEDMFDDLAESGIRFTLLQKGVRPEDMEVLQRHPQIRHPELADFSDTAALLELMDVVVSVDTSVAHLAGAMGRRVWMLLPYSPDWRWMTGRADSPWYPSARLFRQPKPGDWESVLSSLQASLRAL